MHPPATTRFAPRRCSSCRKLSGFTAPSTANEAACTVAIDDVAAVARRLVDFLVTQAGPTLREVEAATAKLRSAARFGTPR